jgi:hypothetical protein
VRPSDGAGSAGCGRRGRAGGTGGTGGAGGTGGEEDETLKIADFGISKVLTSDNEARGLTRTNVVLGSPVYMSPEQCRGAKNMDHRSDVYSVGVVLYECLTGRLPHSGENVNEIMFEIALKDAPDPRTFKPSLDPELAAILMKALARDPEERFQSASAFREALLEWGAARGARVPPTPSSSSRMRVLPPRRLRRLEVVLEDEEEAPARSANRRRASSGCATRSSRTPRRRPRSDAVGPPRTQGWRPRSSPSRSRSSSGRGRRHPGPRGDGERRGPVARPERERGAGGVGGVCRCERARVREVGREGRGVAGREEGVDTQRPGRWRGRAGRAHRRRRGACGGRAGFRSERLRGGKGRGREADRDCRRSCERQRCWRSCERRERQWCRRSCERQRCWRSCERHRCASRRPNERRSGRRQAGRASCRSACCGVSGDGLTPLRRARACSSPSWRPSRGPPS